MTLAEINARLTKINDLLANPDASIELIDERDFLLELMDEHFQLNKGWSEEAEALAEAAIAEDAAHSDFVF